MQSPVSRPRMYKVLCPVPRKDGTTFWMRVGTGFPGKDPTTFNLYLDAFPSEGKMLHLREMDEDDLQRGERRGERRTADAQGPAEELPF